MHLGPSQRCKLLSFLNSDSLGSLLQFGLRLEAHDSSSPLSDQLCVVVVFFHRQVLEDLELSGVGGSNAGNCNTGGSFGVHNGSKAGLILDNHEWNIHLSAKCRHPHDKFKRIDITCNENKLGLLLLDESRDFLQAKRDNVSRFGLDFLSLCSGGSSFLNTLLSSLLGLWSVLVQKGEDCHGLVLRNDLRELVDRRRDLQALVEHGTLALDANVLRPFDETRQITTLGTNGSSDASIAWARGEKRISDLLCRLRLRLGLLTSLGSLAKENIVPLEENFNHALRILVLTTHMHRTIKQKHSNGARTIVTVV